MDPLIPSEEVVHGDVDLIAVEPPAKRAKYEEESELKSNLWNSGCTVCRERDGKYRCPGCNVVTCSLPCTKKHRAETTCKGTRHREAFVPISRFNEDDLLNDIHLLNDFARASEISKRRTQPTEEERLPKRLKVLQSKTRQLGLKLHFLPSFMSKHRLNSSKFDPKTQRLLWHVELRFDLFEEGSLVSFSGLDDSIDATTAIGLILDNPAHKPFKDKVNQLYPADTTQWRCYLLQTMCPANSPLYHALPASSPIRNTLILTDVLEYPTIILTTAQRETEYELYTEEKFKQRSESHLGLIETFAASESSNESGKSDEERDTSSEDSSSEDDSDSSSSSSTGAQSSQTPLPQAE